jgi:hypothetical protein
MSALPSPALLTTDGDYDLTGIAPGKEYLLTLKGTFDGATVALTTHNNALDSYTEVTDGSWTDETEIRFIAPSRKVRLTVTNDGASTSIGVTLIPLV